jgi:hypothetical protein
MKDEFTVKGEEENVFDEQEKAMAATIKKKDNLLMLATRFNAEFTVNESLRRDKELQWMEDLRQAKAIYDPAVVTKIKESRSKVYPKYTRSKEVPCVAKLNHMLFPNNDRNWGIEHTPEPQLKDEQIAMVIENLARNPEVVPSAKAFKNAIKEFARETNENMQRTMDDQLTEAKYPEIGKKVIRSGVRYGTGLIKGPFTHTMERRETVLVDGKPTVKIIKERKPYPEAPSIWCWYPDMTATEYDECDHEYFLHPMSRHQLRQLTKRTDFDKDAINEYIRQNPGGDYKMKSWEIDLKDISSEIAAQSQLRRYQVLERWGFLDGEDLVTAGVDGINEEDRDKEFYTNIWILGNQIIKVALNPTPVDPHTQENTRISHVFYYEKDESSIFGSGLPRSIKDTDMTIAAAARMLLDNGAITSGPIWEIIEELFQNDDIEDIYANRVFKRELGGLNAQYPGIRAHNVDSHIDDYIKIINLFKSIGDDESALPAFLYAQASGNETAEGISVRQSNQNVTIGDIVKNFDSCNESFLRALYAWNMEFNEDPAIKGDGLVKATGSQSLLTKELRARSIDSFVQTMSPADEPYIKRREFIIERAKVRDLDPERFLHTEEDARANIEAQQDREAQALAKAKLEAETRYDHAKAANMEAKAASEGKKMAMKQVETLHKVTNEQEKEKDAGRKSDSDKK